MPEALASIQRTALINLVRPERSRIPGSFNLSHRRGSQGVFCPTTNSNDSNITINSKMWVKPPVGNGKAGVSMRIKNNTAKLLSRKLSTASCSVICLPDSRLLISELNLFSIPDSDYRCKISWLVMSLLTVLIFTGLNK